MSTKSGSRLPAVICVSGTGGGSGKTSFVAHAAAGLATRGKKVLVVDLNPGVSLIYRLLGMFPTGVSLRDYFGRSRRLRDVIVQTSLPNLSFIRHGVLSDVVRGKRIKVARLLHRLRELDFDTVIIDLGIVTDHVKRKYFVDADYRVAVLPSAGSSAEGISHLLAQTAIASFEKHSRGVRGGRAAVRRMMDMFAENPDISPDRLSEALEGQFSELSEIWGQVMVDARIDLVFNSVPSQEEYESAKREIVAVLGSVSRGAPRAYFIPKHRISSGHLPLSDTGNRFLHTAGAVIRDIVGIELFSEAQQRDYFMSEAKEVPASRASAPVEGAPAKSVDRADDYIEEKKRRLSRLEREIEFTRESKLAEMNHQLAQYIDDHRTIAFSEIETELQGARAEMAASLERMREEKLADIAQTVAMRETEIVARLAEANDRKMQEMEQELRDELERARKAKHEELESYFRNAKIAFDHDIMQMRKRREVEVEEEVELKRKKHRSKFESSLGAEVDKVREMVWQQFEEKRTARLRQIDDMIDERRSSKNREVDREIETKREFMEMELHKELTVLRENLLMDVFGDVMEITSFFDVEDFDRRETARKRINREISAEREMRRKRLNVEMAVFREEKEKELMADMESHRKERLKAFDDEMERLREKMQKDVVGESEEVKQKLINKTIELIHLKRNELTVALGKEKEKRYFDLNREVLAAKLKKQADLKKEMENLETELEREVREKILAQERHIATLLDQAFASKKKEKEKVLTELLRDERTKRTKLLNDELMQMRQGMLENVNAEIRVYRTDQKHKLRTELSQMREHRLKKVDQEIQAEIHKKTQSISMSLREAEAQMRQDMQEKTSQEEVRLRKVMTADMNTEMNDLRRRIKREFADEEARAKDQLRAFVEREKEARLKAFQHELNLRKAKNEEHLEEWVEKEKIRYMRDMMTKVGDEEKVQRELISERMQFERRRMLEDLALDRARAEREEKRRIQDWMNRKRSEAIGRVRAIVKAEYQKQFAEMSAKITEEKTRREVGLNYELEKERDHRLTEIRSEINSEREKMLSAMEKDMREVKKRREMEVERYARDEMRRMEERLDARYEALAKKKEEWLQFETRRKQLELSQGVEKEIYAEKEKRLQLHLMNHEIEMNERRRRNLADVEAEKAKILINLRDELLLRRKHMIRKMSKLLNTKVEKRRKKMEDEIENIKMFRRLEIEKGLTEAKERRIEAFEQELEVEHASRVEQMNSRLKTEEYVKRQEMISDMLKKKTELDKFYEQEKKKYYDRLQEEILKNKEISTEYLQEEISRLQKTWRLN